MSVSDDIFLLELRTRDGRLLTQWVIEVGEDASEIDVSREIAWLRRAFGGDATRSNADAILAGDS